MNDLRSAGSHFSRSLNYNAVDTAPAAATANLVTAPVLPKMDTGNGAGRVYEQANRVVISSIHIMAYASIAVVLKLVSVEDPGATAVRRVIRQWYLPATTVIAQDIVIPQGIPTPCREGVPAADRAASLMLVCRNAADGADVNLATAFAAGTGYLSLSIDGLFVPANKQLWAPPITGGSAYNG